MIIEGGNEMPRKAADFDETLFGLLKDPVEAAAYLNEHLEFEGNDKETLFLKALKKVALAQGFDDIADKTQLRRRSLEKALSDQGNPRFSTLTSLLEALGLKVSIEVAEKKAS